MCSSDLTQAAVPNGQKFTYDFVVPDAGTYWFHSHVGTQLDRGLYGPLIIEDPSDKVDYDDDLVVVLDDWIDGTGTNPDQVIDARLTGPVNGYTWPVNGRLYNPPNDGVPVKPNQRVRIRFINDSMMFHPFHLHGHTFQVTNNNVAKARKDTVLVPPKQTVEVDFDTNNPGRWITHCHNTYHLEAGMAFFLEYSG